MRNMRSYHEAAQVCAGGRASIAPHQVKYKIPSTKSAVTHIRLTKTAGANNFD